MGVGEEVMGPRARLIEVSGGFFRVAMILFWEDLCFMMAVYLGSLKG